MKLVPYDEKKIGRIYRPCKNQKIIQEFLDSGEKCVKVEDYSHRDAGSCRNALALSAKRMGISNVIVVTRKGRVRSRAFPFSFRIFFMVFSEGGESLG